MCYIMGMSDLFNKSEDTSAGIAEDTGLKEPDQVKVIFYNDDFTTMEFVVDILVSIFNKVPGEAEILMQHIHKNGSCVIGTYTYDIAVSRANLTKSIARKNGYPLKVEVE